MSTSKRQPRFITSKFDGRCADCGRETRAGERVFWRARGEVECGDCAAFNGRDVDSVPAAQPAAPQQSAPAAQSGDFHAALTWDDTPPARGASIGSRNSAPNPHAASNRLIAEAVKRDPSLVANRGKRFAENHPNADNCDECGKLDELSHNDYTGTALCGDCDDAANAAAAIEQQQSAPVVDLAARRIADHVSEQREAPELDALSQTVADLLVTLVNCVDRLDSEQCDALRANALHYAEQSASGSRRRTWQAFAKFIA